MTSRLKKKLGDLGVDPASARANESFCLIGTPLPPLEKSKDTGEFVPLWKQEVRDEKGRRRLHGAFTGGFSAGYFNSVGSKEGWAPSTFVSSRGDRAKQKTARPEDFMDEEDLQEIKDSRNLVDTTDEMDLTGGTQAELKRRGVEDPESDSIADALASSLLPPVKDSAGARILKKMGWKIGQGIGPRVSLHQRRLQDLQASSHRAVGEDVKITEDDEEASKHTYAPRDTPILLVDRKDNSHGLGYHPGMGLNESLGAGGAASGPAISAGFGLGALNDADDDDVDIYDVGSRSRARTAYDIADREDDDRIVIGEKSKASRSPVRRATALQTFHDGQAVLAGFVLSEKPVSEDRWFPMPDVPKGWVPDPTRVWDRDNKENAQSHAAAPSRGKPSAGISADQRGTILGETPLPAAPRSVFDYMSQKDRERLQKAVAGAAAAPHAASAPAAAPGPSPPAIPTVPRTEPHIAHAALAGFKPFPADIAKQARYTAYLQSQAALDGSVPAPVPLPGQPIDAYNKELEDYAKAALIFKPISGAMASRFTSAAVVEHGPVVHEGLHTPSDADRAAAAAQADADAAARVTPAMHAASANMYGPLTRTTRAWTPARLLCKRFRVKDPNPPPDEPAAAAAAAAGTSAAGAEPPAQAEAEAPSAAYYGTAGRSTAGKKDLANVGLGDDADQGRDTLTYERPTMDIFKAIFASDDEDSDDEDVKAEPDDAPLADAGLAVAPAGSRPAAPLPQRVASAPADDKVDIGSFRPTFIPREGKSAKTKTKTKDKKEKKKAARTLISFEVDDKGEDTTPQLPKERPKKKKRKEKREDEDDAMWVEKPPPEIVKDLAPEAPTAVPPSGEAVSDGSSRARKRAIDFM